MQFETDGGAIGSTVISQISPGRKNRLWLEVDGAEEAVVFYQEEPETLWCGRREARRSSRATSPAMTPDASRLSFLPAGHPQGYADCFDLFVADAARGRARRGARDGMPLFADGLRSAQIVEAVLASARGSAGSTCRPPTRTEVTS